MTDALPATYNSNTELALGSIPQVADPEVYEALLDVHNAIENLLKSGDSANDIFTAYIAQRRNFSSTSVTANYTVLTTDGIVRVDASAGDVTVTMYPVANGPGYLHEIKRIDTVPGNTVTLLGDGAELIDGHAAGVKISTLSSYSVKSHTTGWDLV